MTKNIFQNLEEINSRPQPFEYYTASDLWNDEYTSKQMLEFHLNEEVDMSSRNTAFIDKSIEWITSYFKVGEGMKIADFGCGPGLYSIRLAKNKSKVTGIDFSTRSINYARETAEKEHLVINYINQDYLQFETDDRFDLIIMIMCDFCALNPAQRQILLSKFRKLLSPEGSVLLDSYSLKAFEEREEIAKFETNLLNGFWAPGKYYGFLNTFKYNGEKVVLDKYTIIEPHRTRTVYNWLQYFSPEQIEQEFMKCGLKIDRFLSDVAGTSFIPESKEFAVIAKRI
jgi:cyclopropane fatty-acyl-phospholipid synthase-like methyltransferase